MADTPHSLDAHRVVSREQWISERTAFLAKEKEFTRLRDEINRLRRELPWEEIKKHYVFDGPVGRETLSDLFEGRSQLITYHFMFDPAWDAGCPHCSFWADNFNEVIIHLNQRDVTMVAVSRAPFEKLDGYRKRMGWSFKWLSSLPSDFNRDFGVSFTPEEVERKEAFYNFRVQNPGKTEREGVSVFFKSASEEIFRTYSAYARGIDLMNTAYNYMDLVPKGRDEGTRSQYWVRRHDEYSSR